MSVTFTRLLNGSQGMINSALVLLREGKNQRKSRVAGEKMIGLQIRSRRVIADYKTEMKDSEVFVSGQMPEKNTVYMEQLLHLITT